MKIFIIGANSALAKSVIPLLKDVHAIVTADRSGCDMQCDITEEVTIPERTDVVINFAAAFGGESDEDIVSAEETNARGALNICIAAKKAGVKHIVMTSSMSAVLDKTAPYYSVYAISKRHGDELAEFYCRLHKIPLTILRPSQIYGDSNEFAKHQPFFHEIIDKAEKGVDVVIYGTHNARRNYIHVADLAAVMSRVVAKRVAGTYPCLYPTDTSFSEIASTAQQVFSKGGKVVFMKGKPDIPDNVFDYEPELYEKINFSPKISLEMGLQRIKNYRGEKSQ